MDDENVTKLPIAFKKPPDQDAPALEIVRPFGKGCDHLRVWVGNRLQHVTYQIREGETEIQCGNCAVKLDPMWVMLQLARQESEWRYKQTIYQQELKRLQERERTECQHCGKQTRISRTKPRAKATTP